jgi:lipoprotein signal peptidase
MGCGLLIRSDEEPAFSVANSVIVVGAGLLVLEILFHKSSDRDECGIERQ